jgi:hypothetical protein
LRIEVEEGLYLRGAPLASMAPDIAHGDGLDGRLFGSELNHMHMTFAPSPTAQLSQSDATIRANNPRIRSRVHAGRQKGNGRLFCKGSSVDFHSVVVCHFSP